MDQLSTLSAAQRLALLRSLRFSLDSWLLLSPRVNLSGYPEVLRFRGLVARAEAAERMLARHASGDERRLQHLLEGRAARGRPTGQRDAVVLRRRGARGLAAALRRGHRGARAAHGGALGALRAAARRLERLDLGLADVQARLGHDAAQVDLLRVGGRYLAWVVRAQGDPVRIDLGAAEGIESACGELVAAITEEGDGGAAGATLRSLVWGPIEAKLGDGVRRVTICPDAALAAVPVRRAPGPRRRRVPPRRLRAFLRHAGAGPRPLEGRTPRGSGALVVGGVDYEHADVGPKERPVAPRPEALAVVDRAPRGGAFVAIPQTKAEAEALRDRFGKDATTLLLGADATEARLREAAKGKRFVHVATHGFAREDLLAGLYTRRIAEAFTSADMERQLAAGHDPMLLSGLALAGANPREGANGDDGILTALEASYLDPRRRRPRDLVGVRDGEGDRRVGRGRAGAGVVRPRWRGRAA